jgi:ribosomal protein L1
MSFQKKSSELLPVTGTIIVNLGTRGSLPHLVKLQSEIVKVVKRRSSVAFAVVHFPAGHCRFAEKVVRQ